jgi:hypothetical protein
MKLTDRPKIKAKVTFEWEYEINPECYLYNGKTIDNLTIEDIKEIERQNFESDCSLFIDTCRTDPKLELEEVKEE